MGRYNHTPHTISILFATPSQLSLNHPSWGCFQPMKIVSLYRGPLWRSLLVQSSILLEKAWMTLIGLAGLWKLSSKIVLFRQFYKCQYVVMKVVFHIELGIPFQCLLRLQKNPVLAVQSKEVSYPIRRNKYDLYLWRVAHGYLML